MTTSETTTILIVEDDPLFAFTLQGYLAKRGFSVEVEGDGARAVGRILEGKPEAVVLDCGLPGKDGYAVCREVREAYRGVIMMLTANDADEDQVLGLDLGADAYLRKPAIPDVVLATLRSCLRRGVPAVQEKIERHQFGQFVIDRSTRTVHMRGSEVFCNTAEFDLLWLLASNAGLVLSRDDVSTALRGLEYDGLDRSIDMRISRLRKALGDSAERPMRIKTVRGKGYLFSRTSWE